MLIHFDFLIPILCYIFCMTVWAWYFRVYIQPIRIKRESASYPPTNRRKELVHHHVIIFWTLHDFWIGSEFGGIWFSFIWSVDLVCFRDSLLFSSCRSHACLFIPTCPVQLNALWRPSVFQKCTISLVLLMYMIKDCFLSSVAICPGKMIS